MKKRILIAVAAVCIAGGGVALFAGNEYEPELYQASSRCFSESDRNNNGNCVFDMGFYICNKNMPQGIRDCWVGEYLPPIP